MAEHRLNMSKALGSVPALTRQQITRAASTMEGESRGQKNGDRNLETTVWYYPAKTGVSR